MHRYHKFLQIENVSDFLRLSYFFKKAGNELYLVGGCVRDMLLGVKPKDYDLCTNLTPDEMKALLSNQTYYDRELAQEARLYDFIDTGLKHGTVTVHDRESNQFYEITTYRVDGKYSDGRHPDEVTFTPNLEEDLMRRDFTINSFAYDLGTEEVVMLDKSFLDDLKYGIVRCVGDPKMRFGEDALRMLRALRFAAQKGFILETGTYEAMKECAPLLERISKERIRDELTKILMSDNPRYLELMVCAGLEPYMFNGKSYVSELLSTEHENPHHYADVFHHTLDVIERVPKDFVLRWAALLHDIGKPYVKALKPGTTDHYRFLGHEEKSAEIASELMEMLRFPKDESELIVRFVLNHDRDLAECSMTKFRKALNDIGVDEFPRFMKLKEADSSAHKLTVTTKHAVDDVCKCYDRYRDVVDNPMTALTVRDLKVNGNDLMALGLKGREIGEALNKLLGYVLENPSLNTKESLVKIVSNGSYS